ncbi:hypothetical protein LCGC14_1331060 [marine sediment metagenome]|uniref:Uncharacterized protein n=1 Tax=marine sediment metagenome TaxID=412755 RepID=A0A0F9NJ40_9ZZZZ
MDFLTILPNLSIGVIAILALVYLSKKFLDRLESKDKEFTKELGNREDAFRALEKEVRTTVMQQLADNTHAFKKVINHIDKLK